HVLVNGVPLDEPYLAEGMPTYPAPDYQSAMTYPARVPAGRVFVLGDNRTGSSDSRANKVGFVRVDDLLGKVLFRVKPFFESKPSFHFTYQVK
ncbi:MAG: signal peptidase I, partial [Oscillospiraceae bacterium]|nr:signal peptidase I [Oscillospiraceae bacterium]